MNNYWHQESHFCIRWGIFRLLWNFNWLYNLWSKIIWQEFEIKRNIRRDNIEPAKRSNQSYKTSHLMMYHGDCNSSPCLKWLLAGFTKLCKPNPNVVIKNTLLSLNILQFHKNYFFNFNLMFINVEFLNLYSR